MKVSSEIFSARSIFMIAVVLMAFISGCVKDVFTTEYPDVRAYYVERKDYLPPERVMVSVRSSATEMITLVSQLFQEKFDTTASVIRMDGPNAVRSSKNSRLLFKVITPAIEPDDVDEFRKFFYIGEYILDRPGMEVVPEYFQFSVDADVKVDGPNLGVEFTLNPYVDWNLYAIDLDGQRRQIPDKMEPYYGVGSFRTKKTVVELNRSGKEVESVEWVEQRVNDEPRTRGIIEVQLANRLLELAAINNLNATIKTSYQ